MNPVASGVEIESRMEFSHFSVAFHMNPTGDANSAAKKAVFKKVPQALSGKKVTRRGV